MTTKDTRQKILDAALELFRERGFAEATMREIAARAGVATGLAYYYFKSKDAIVLAFYQQARDDLGHRARSGAEGRAGGGPGSGAHRGKVHYFKPNRRFLGALMAHAADASSPLSPFGEPSREIREFDLAHFERALAETKNPVPSDLAPHIAKILWFYQMGLLLFWIYDRSPQQRRSQALLATSLDDGRRC